MHKFLFILAGIIVLLILFMTLTHFKTIEEVQRAFVQAAEQLRTNNFKLAE